MSIPTPFNPLGTLGGELPLPQAVMTSNTTGRAADGTPLPVPVSLYGGWSKVDNAYKAMDGNVSTSQKIDDVPATESWWSMKIRVRFGKNVKLSELNVDLKPDNRGNLIVYYMENGVMREWSALRYVTKNVRTTVKFTPLLEVEASEYIIGWKTLYAYADIYEITYVGTYKQ